MLCFENLTQTKTRTRLSALLLVGALTAVPATAQPTYSIDFQGPTIGLPDSALGVPIGAGDILTQGIGTPAMITPAGILGMVPAGATGQIEIDALSYGFDSLLPQVGGPSVFFSVDEFADGVPGAPAPPNVTSEGAAGNQQASADVFSRLGLPPLPIAPGPVFGNGGIFDGDGIVPFLAPGLTLIEPNPPTVGALPDPGDNLDALACAPAGFNQIFFSLDAAWVDPLEGAPANSGTAAANGFTAGDVLVVNSGGGVPAIWASHVALGLTPADDLDALILRDNGNGIYDPSFGPFDWMTGGTDMLLFSIRRTSPLIGTPDAFFGAPIEEGDILTVTGGGGGVPGILIPAEALGLRTVRSHGPGPFGFGDEIDALSLPPC